MSDLLSRAMSSADPWDEAAKAISWLETPFPNLHSLLAGRREKDKVMAVLPGSVRLFSNGGELKAEFTGPEWIMKGYLVLPKEVTVLESIEIELAAGRIGWSVKGERASGSKTPSY